MTAFKLTRNKNKNVDKQINNKYDRNIKPCKL